MSTRYNAPMAGSKDILGGCVTLVALLGMAVAHLVPGDNDPLFLTCAFIAFVSGVAARFTS
jgi:hypothetical protein